MTLIRQQGNSLPKIDIFRHVEIEMQSRLQTDFGLHNSLNTEDIII